MAGNLITSLLSQATNLLQSITASAHAPSSSSNSNNLEKERARAAEKDMERLMRTLKWIKATMYDAEEREIIDRSVKFWLKELKKIAYDAEDVLSEYQYEVTRVQVEARKASEASGSQKRKQMEYIVPIPDGIVDRLNKIRSRFDEIAKDREALQLRESDGVRRQNNKILRPPTGHMVDEANIFGRDTEITKVTDLLLSKTEMSFSVISIVGKGGLGKTTIAQLVYNDGRVSQCFDFNGWVCVSEEFNVRRLITSTIESFSKTNIGLSELSQLQVELAKIVNGKTILLVLDDVWNENHNLWESFRVPFKEARMVRILVTTRNKKVANVMQTTTCFNPSNLSEYSCWQLFQHYAFNGTSYTMPIHLVDMGKEITRKCGGLPLAVKSIASLLRHEADEEVWREILDSDIWEIKESNEEIFPALQISYSHLPAHLKPCFLLCSMYPKDYILLKEDLIKLWIAHGYVKSRSNRKLKEIGVDYWNELKERSFLDDYETMWYNPESCKLHDIIHDLAQLISENEHYSVEINQPLDIQERTVTREAYHLYVRGSMRYVNQIPQQTMKGLRTIFMDIPNRGEYGYCTNCTKEFSSWWKKVCNDCLGDITLCNLTQFEVLRVLIVKWDILTKTPHSISELKHLTYLSITSKHLKVLPLSIGLLYNLLALEVKCEILEYLPENIGDLANLQFLSICANIKKLPKSLGSLANLLELTIERNNVLLDYVPHGLVNFPSITKVQEWWKVRTIGWLKDMKDLKGMISIGKLKNINDLEDAKRANLRNKCELEILELCWDDHMDGFRRMDSRLKLDLVPGACEGGIVGVDDIHFSLLECLQPHPNVKKLGVKGYPSAILPGWMRDPLLLKSIQRLKLERCGIRTMQLVQLPSQLKTLQILGCDHLELITGLGHLDILEILEIGDCKSLKSLTMDGLQLVESTECFSDSSHEIPHINRQSISFLLVKNYPSAILPGWMRDPLLLQAIQVLWFNKCGYIESLPFGNLHTLKHLSMSFCSGIRTMQLELLPSQLEILHISRCNHLELITGLGHLDILAELEIIYCETLKSLTMDGLQLVESTELFGDSSHEIPQINRQSISSLRKLEIFCCGSLHSLPDGLIPFGPCDVCVKYCGCPNYYKSIKESPPRPSIEFNLLSSFRPQESPPRPLIEMNLLSSFRPQESPPRPSIEMNLPSNLLYDL